MVRLVVDIPKSLVGRVKTAVEEGGYENAREFVQTAIENQLELEEADVDDQIPTFDEVIQEEATSTPLQRADEPTSSAEGGLHDGFERHSLENVPRVVPPDPERIDQGPLWGQYNRIFPIKLVLRRLANEIVDDRQTRQARLTDGPEGTVELPPFRDETAGLARQYGFEIQRADEQYSRGRGEKLASALPTGDDEQKSIERFKSHFVGGVDRNGNFSGAPATMKLVGIDHEQPYWIGLTDAGAKFAELPNPLLDEGPFAEESLSDDEREFYVNHVRENLPGEFEAMMTAARSIVEGHDRPESLTERVARLAEDWSQTQANTIRSGLVSRMYELNLVDRERVGQRGIAYLLTEQGRSLLEATDY